MRVATVGITVVSTVLIAGLAWGQAPSTALRPVDINKLTCKEVMAGNDSDRDAVMAFFHGYMAGKSSSKTVDVTALGAKTDAVKDFCLSNPTTPVMDAFHKPAK